MSEKKSKRMRKRVGEMISARQPGREGGSEGARQGTRRGRRGLACLCDCLFKSNVNNKRLYDYEKKVDGEIFVSFISKHWSDISFDPSPPAACNKAGNRVWHSRKEAGRREFCVL